MSGRERVEAESFGSSSSQSNVWSDVSAWINAMPSARVSSEGGSGTNNHEGSTLNEGGAQADQANKPAVGGDLGRLLNDAARSSGSSVSDGVGGILAPASTLLPNAAREGLREAGRRAETPGTPPKPNDAGAPNRKEADGKKEADGRKETDKTEEINEGEDGRDVYENLAKDLMDKKDFITNEDIKKLMKGEMKEEDLLASKLRQELRFGLLLGIEPEQAVQSINENLEKMGADFRLKVTDANFENNPGFHLDMVDAKTGELLSDGYIRKRIFVSMKY